MSIRELIPAISILVASPAACGGGGISDLPDAAIVQRPDAPPAGVVVASSPAIDVPPGQFAAWCYYDHLAIRETAIRSWEAILGPGIAEASLLAVAPGIPDGTLARCDGGSEIGPVHLFDAIADGDRMELPADDGTGSPVGQVLAPGQAFMVRIVTRDDGAAALRGAAEFRGLAAPDLRVTRAGSFVAINSMIDVLPGAPDRPSRATFGGICDLGRAGDGRFFSLSIRTRAHGVAGEIRDDAGTVVASDRPSVPGAARGDPGVRISGQLRHQCDYVNQDSYRIEYGIDPGTSETCEAVGLYYPSPDGAQITCLNSDLLN